jgi:hypothetical protein
VADAPVAPPQIPTMDTSIVPSTNGHLPPPATTTNPPRSSAAAENSRPSEPVTPHPLQKGEGTPEPVDQHPTADEITRLVECALAANHSMEAFGTDMRRLMGLPESRKITKKFLRERMIMAQYERARAAYGETLRQILEEDVPNFPPSAASDAEPPAPAADEKGGAQVPFVSSSSALDPAAEAKAKLRAEVATWNLKVSADEVEYVISRYPPDKARNLLWGARKPKPEPTPLEALAAAD